MTTQAGDGGRGLRHVAEFVTSLAVLVTLVLVALELRQNTDATQAASYAQSMDALTDWRLAIASDPDLASVWSDYMGGAEPDDARIRLLINALWGIYENAYYSWRRGIMGDSEWSRFERLICQRRDREFARGITNLLTAEFIEYAESRCGPSPAGAPS